MGIPVSLNNSLTSKTLKPPSVIPRVIAFDDSPFSRRDKHTSIVGVIMRKDLYIESLITKRIEVDGTDATEKILDTIREKGSGVRVIMTQGITLGGFNVLDVKELFRETGIPIINVVDHEPNMKAIKDALKKYFEERRVGIRGQERKKNGFLISDICNIEPSTNQRIFPGKGVSS